MTDTPDPKPRTWNTLIDDEGYLTSAHKHTCTDGFEEIWVVEKSYADALSSRLAEVERDRSLASQDRDSWKSAFDTQKEAANYLIARLESELADMKSKNAYLQQNYAEVKDNEKILHERLASAGTEIEQLKAARDGAIAGIEPARELIDQCENVVEAGCYIGSFNCDQQLGLQAQCEKLLTAIRRFKQGKR